MGPELPNRIAAAVIISKGNVMARSTQAINTSPERLIAVPCPEPPSRCWVLREFSHTLKAIAPGKSNEFNINTGEHCDKQAGIFF
jgi:hypothetical protein